MEKKKALTLVLLLLLTLCAAATFGKSASVLLREGLYAEEVEGDLDAAIDIYRQIIADSTAQRKLVALALYRQGMCFLKKKNEPEARAAFQKLVTDYSDQTDVVEKVKPLLQDLGNADPASLMPPGTLAYIEIGSPGRQVETILNMLKGTPFENPLAVINAGQPAGQTGTANDPAAMLSRILNPSTMAEFKKIRGIGIGITGLQQDNPPVTVVLFPGQSDALRGIIRMILGFVGQPSGDIEGMQIFSIGGEGGFAAYDDAVVILTSPSQDARDRLEWSVRQYKGVAGRPTLASSNASFAKISKQARQQNALTLWLNVNEAYEKLETMLPPAVMQQVKMADGMVDLQHIDDLIASLSLRETGVALEANLNFEAGYQSMAYSMIRTPHLNRAALTAVPPNAIALISIALGGPDTPQAAAVGQQIKNAMGLDLGPELFGNIEQITLFALPPDKWAEPVEGQLPAAFNSLGLAVTGSNPPQTRQLFTKLLQSVNLMYPGAEATEPVDGKYEFTLANYQKIFCQINEASKTTVLSLDADLAEKSAAGLAGGASAVREGRLGDTLSTLSPATSKLVAVNVAGALKVAAQNMNLPSEEAAEQVRTALAELADAAEKTTVRLQTSEQQDSFGIRLSVSDLPPMNEVVGPIMQIVQTLETAKTQQAAQTEKAAMPAGVTQTARPPAINGQVDDCWNAARSYDLANIAYVPPSSDGDFSASFRALWDQDNLYVLVEVTDDDLSNDSEEFWQDDAVEIFIDAGNAKAESYGDNDYQYHFGWDRSVPTMGEAHHGNVTGVEYAFATTGAGYRAEIKLPWNTLGTEPKAGTQIGLDVHANDDDAGGDRDSKLMWMGQQDDAWQRPASFGTAELLGLVGWWKLDESAGTRAADGSGNNHAALVRGNPTWQPTGGKVAGAVALDGDGDYLEVADESAFDFRSGVTVAAWIKAESLDKPYQAIVTKGEWAWRIQRNEESNMLEFACSGVRVPSEHPYGPLYGTRAITPGRWYHVAGTYDGQRMALYIDGVLDSSQEASGPIGVDDDPVLIGENAEQRERFWSGLIDDVRVYNYGLSADEVTNLAR